jgi:hypothetical protein
LELRKKRFGQLEVLLVCDACNHFHINANGTPAKVQCPQAAPAPIPIPSTPPPAAPQTTGNGVAIEQVVEAVTTLKGHLPHSASSSFWVNVGAQLGTELWAGRSLHSGKVTPLFCYEWEERMENAHVPDDRSIPKCAVPSFRLEIFCENQERQLIEVKFDPQLWERKEYTCEARPVK